MFEPIKGGSKQIISFDEQEMTVHLPPVGYVRNLLNGGKLEKRPILFETQPIIDQKWQRTELPEDWKKKRNNEKARQQLDKEVIDKDLEEFREQEWDRRINGIWMAIGNRNKKKTEYVYLTGLAYFYFNWWKCDFGYPNFRFIYLEVFYLQQLSLEDPDCFGVTLSTLRRFGKTAILGCYLYEHASRVNGAYAGFQAQTTEDAKKKFALNVIGPWSNLPDFFRPIYDYNSTQSTDIQFKTPTPKGKSQLQIRDEDDESLQSIINYRHAKTTAYDGEKLHRYAMEEPGKTTECDVRVRWGVVKPCLKKEQKIIGNIFCPTTIEEAEEGGDNFIDLFEKSFFSLKKKNKNNQTTSGMYAHFISALKGYIYDEYGRSVIDDPKKGEIVYDEEGELITKGARSLLEDDRASFDDDPSEKAKNLRRYPFTWEEAKIQNNDQCVFNAMHLNQRISDLSVLESMKIYESTKGNFIYKDEAKKIVEFDPNPNGKWSVSYLFKDPIKEANRIKADGSYGGISNYVPLNDNKFAIATDPVDHKVVVDKVRASKAAFYVFRKFDMNVDDPNTKDKEGRIKWETHNFIVQYVNRTDDPLEYYEDLLKTCIYYGTSMLAENQKVGVLNYFRMRGFDAFVMNRPVDTFTAEGMSQDTPGIPASAPVIAQYTNKLQSFYKNHYHRVKFKELLKDSLRFKPEKTKEHDETVAAGYTLIAEEAKVEVVKEIVYIDGLLDRYSNSGSESEKIK